MLLEKCIPIEGLDGRLRVRCAPPFLRLAERLANDVSDHCFCHVVVGGAALSTLEGLGFPAPIFPLVTFGVQ